MRTAIAAFLLAAAIAPGAVDASLARSTTSPVVADTAPASVQLDRTTLSTSVGRAVQLHLHHS
jgi:hypothetical protein